MMPKTPPRLTFAGIALSLASLAGGGAFEYTTGLLLEGVDEEPERSAVVVPVEEGVAPTDLLAGLGVDLLSEAPAGDEAPREAEDGLREVREPAERGIELREVRELAERGIELREHAGHRVQLRALAEAHAVLRHLRVEGLLVPGPDSAGKCDPAAPADSTVTPARPMPTPAAPTVQRLARRARV